MRSAAALLSCLCVAGCGISGGEDVGKRTTPGGATGRITVDELDQLTKSLADRFVLLMAAVCDDLKRGGASAPQRRIAQELKMSVATSSYDAATGPDPVKQLVDLAVVVELHKIIWVDEGQAERSFGAAASGPLREALETVQKEIWEFSLRAMSPDRIRVFRDEIAAWRRAHPGPRVTDARFDVVAGKQSATLVEEIMGVLSPPSGSVTDSLGEARLLGQRAFYYLKRLPMLVDWQVEASLENALTAVEGSATARGMSKTLESAAGLLSRLEEILSSSGDGPVDGTLREIHRILAEGKELARSVQGAAEAFSPKGKEAPKTDAKPFDVDAYTTALRAASTLVRDARDLTESEPAMRRLETLVTSITGDMARQKTKAARQATWGAALLIVLIALAASLYTTLLVWLLKRGRPGNNSGNI